MSHSTNFTAGHETRTHMIGQARFDYPSWHIEADNRLAWLLGRLDRRFGQKAFYIHLLRNPDAVAASFVQRADKGIMLAYRSEILMRAQKLSKETPMLDFAHDYISTVTENIEFFLRDKPGKLTLNIEDMQADIGNFWNMIGAEGDITLASEEFKINHNKSR